MALWSLRYGPLRRRGFCMRVTSVRIGDGHPAQGIRIGENHRDVTLELIGGMPIPVDG